MSTFDLPTLTATPEASADAAEQTLIAALRAYDPNLDLRRGTALRDLLVGPAARIAGAADQRAEVLRIARSLQLLRESDLEDRELLADELLANYRVVRRTGASATAVIEVLVNTSRVFTLNVEDIYSVSGAEFTPTTDFIVNPTPAAGELLLEENPGGGFRFRFPAQAVASGALAITAGDAVSLDQPFTDFVSAKVWGEVSAGADAETLEEVVERFPHALANRNPGTGAALDAMLRDESYGNFGDLVATSVQGHGSPVQVRDGLGPAGIRFGGRADVWMRGYQTPVMSTLEVTGTRIGTNAYQVTLNPGDFPGFVALASVSDVEADFSPSFAFGDIQPYGGYPTTVTTYIVPGDSYAVQTGHPASGAGSAFAGATLTVTNVADGDDTRVFKVTAYVDPMFTAVHTYLSRADVRPLHGDLLARTARVCFVAVRARVYRSAGEELDVEALTAAVVSAVNRANFESTLSVDRIVRAMDPFPLSSIALGDATGALRLAGAVYGASGTVYRMEGTTLRLSTLDARDDMIDARTTVYVTEPARITLEVHDV